MTITSFSPTARLMFLLAVVCFLSIFTPRVGWAGSYSISSYSGGTYNGGGTYVTSNGQYGHGFGGVCPPGTGGTGTVSGQITATFTWAPDPNNPNDQPPQCVVVSETCTASWSGSTKGSGTCTGSCDNGLGATSVPAQGSLGATSAGSGYVVKNNPGTSFTVQCSPKATFTISGSGVNSARGYASVWYSASASPVIMQVTGTTSDSNGGQDILVGQQCAAKLVGVPSGCIPTYAWSASGTTLQSWSSSTPATATAPANPNASYEVDGIGTASNSSVSWYWNDSSATTETVTCAVTMASPSGQGSSSSGTLSLPVFVMVPKVLSDSLGIGGYVSVNSSELQAMGVIGSGETGGMNINLDVATPTTPAFGTGQVAMVQIITPQEGYVSDTYPQQTFLSSDNGMTGLDTQPAYPDSGRGTGAGDATQFDRDSPGIGLFYPNSTDPSYANSYVYIGHNFTDYLMYAPPGASNPVPLATFTWSVSGNATIPTDGNWADYATQNGTDAAGTVDPNTATSFTQGNTYPSWTRIILATDPFVAQ